jgi:hypothetical protein
MQKRQLETYSSCLYSFSTVYLWTAIMSTSVATGLTIQPSVDATLSAIQSGFAAIDPAKTSPFTPHAPYLRCCGVGCNYVHS